jgi:hypothetical protein
MPSCASSSAALQRPRDHRGQRDQRAVVALAQHRGPAQLADQLAVRDLVLARVQALVLEEEHRVGVADGGRQQADDVGGRRGRDHLQAGHGHRPVLHALRVLRAEAQPATVGGADHQRERHLAVGHVPRLGDLVGDDVPADGEEVREHDLGDRSQPVIAAPIVAPRMACSEIGVSRTRCGPNCSSRPTVVLNTPPAAATSSPRNTTLGSRAISWAIPAGHGLAVGQRRHVEPPSAHTSVST